MRIRIKGKGREKLEPSIDVEIGENVCSISVGWNGIFKGVHVRDFREAGNELIRAGKILLLLDELKRIREINASGGINPRPFRSVAHIFEDLNWLGWKGNFGVK